MRIVILGGGFGGLYAAKALRRAPAEITIVDRRNYHVFQPLLYQVATAALNPSDIAYPIRSVLRRQKNASVISTGAPRSAFAAYRPPKPPPTMTTLIASRTPARTWTCS